MSPEERKTASETVLIERGVRINRHLPMIEADDQVELRSSDELMQRLVALWAVVGSAFLPENKHFREYITQKKYESWLSGQELAFLLNDSRNDRDYVEYTWKLECIYFLAWCAGLIDRIEIPETESSVESILHLFPQGLDEPVALQSAISIRSKDEILRWADMLYRLHWAVRDASLNGSQAPENLNAGVVQEWHLAVNWMTRYGNEDNWDEVGTDT